MSTKLLKAFISRDDFTIPGDDLVAPIFEITELSRTYSYNKQSYYPSNYSRYIIHSFDYKNVNKLTDSEANLITGIVVQIVNERTAKSGATKTRFIHDFLEDFNYNNPTSKITSLDYSGLVSHGGVIAPDYMEFTVKDIECKIWLSNDYFSKLYPDNDIKVVLPFHDFKNVIINSPEAVHKLTNFDLVEFNNRIDRDRNGVPQTVSRTFNIPYTIPGTTTSYPCYFGFNIYGISGDNELVIRQELYRYLRDEIGIEAGTIETYFPTILDVNEFFIVPRWTDIAIPSRVGLGSINSQVTPAYADTFDTMKYIEVYKNSNFVRDNTYKVPFEYNNITLMVVNGIRSTEVYKDFYKQYPDIISVGTMHPDFSRMSSNTQQLLVMLDRLINLCDSNTQIELLTKLVEGNSEYIFNLTRRLNTEYVSVLFKNHIWYMLPKYEMLRLDA